MATTEQVTLAAWLAFGLEPSWTEQTPIDVGGEPGPPEIGDGVDVEDSILALMRVQLNEDPTSPRGWVWVDTVANSQTYTITINGVDHDYVSDASATEAEILEGLRAAIAAGAQPVTASVTTWRGLNVVLIESDTTSTFTLATSATGSGVLDDSLEAESVDFRVWVFGKDKTTPDLAEGYEDKTITANWTQRIEIGGYRELFIEITSTDGYVIPEVGPCVDEA